MAWGPFNAGGGGGSSGGTAADISYDNSKSGISAANVQEAIDALSVLTLTIQAVPAQSGSLTYTGSTQSPTWKGYDSSMMTIGGVTSGINAGTYTATFTPIGKYVWTDGTQEAKSVSWTSGRAEVKNVPAQTGSVTYNGSAQSPSWSNYNSSQLTIGGTSSATNAGSYSATFTPTSNYKWSDGTTTAKSENLWHHHCYAAGQRYGDRILWQYEHCNGKCFRHHHHGDRKGDRQCHYYGQCGCRYQLYCTVQQDVHGGRYAGVQNLMPLSSVSTTIPARRAATASTSCWARSAASLLVWWIVATAARLPRLVHSR